jgi:hypothetical protein
MAGIYIYGGHDNAITNYTFNPMASGDACYALFFYAPTDTVVSGNVISNSTFDGKYYAANYGIRQQTVGTGIVKNNIVNGCTFHDFVSPIINSGTQTYFGITIQGCSGMVGEGEYRSQSVPLIAGISGTNPKCTYWENMSPNPIMIDQISTRRTTKSTGAATGNLDVVVATTLRDCQTAWDANADHVIATAETSEWKVGTKSNKFVIAAGIANGDLIATDVIPSTDVSTHVGVAFWIKAETAVASGDLLFLLDEHATCATPSALLTIPALPAGDWTRIIVDYDLIPVDLTRDAIISVGLEYHANAGANTIWIDDVKSIPAPSTTLGNALNLAAAEGIYDSRDTSHTSLICNGQGATTGFVVLNPSATTSGMIGSMYIHYTGV